MRLGGRISVPQRSGWRRDGEAKTNLGILAVVQRLQGARLKAALASLRSVK